MIVVDASALTNLMVYTDERGTRASEAMNRDSEWVAPEHWRAETFSAIRGLTLGRKIEEAQGAKAVRRIAWLTIHAAPLDPLLPRMWELRNNISAYDAAYVAVAEDRMAALVTADARLATAASAYCRVELVS
ncbi:putative nucleic acid-binding protein [Catenuloplanes nepalensis]|uniref:Ribonuclease VapC n=1 Tax=Catenuloplanes nepalensis TaxID=587533 RepID=A0ABT9N1E4_9ACTN|nr:PIN domain-containing protein [Catenuloplanes nepalensis]MDP9797415.1 putative nucleic acid-binding protein [Catenuloplanes nepalensis]